MKFEFDKTVLQFFKQTVVKSTLKTLYNEKNGKGHATKDTIKMGVYAIFLLGRLMKIGRAIDGGIFKRMSQYYRGKDGAHRNITSINRDSLEVWYFTLNNARDCWAAEKYLQAKAYYAGETMPWDEEIRPKN